MITVTTAVLATKGGVGKSVLCQNAGVCLPRTALLDLDPQKTVRAWLDARRLAGIGDPKGFAYGDNPAQVAGLVAKARESGTVDYVFIDTPPSTSDLRCAQAAIDVADVVLMPVRPAKSDIAATRTAIEMVVRRHKKLAFVITQSPSETRAKDAAAALAPYGTVAPVFLMMRAVYLDAVNNDVSVVEFDPAGKAADEHRRLWQWFASWVA